MSTNLKTVSDHPAEILKDEYKNEAAGILMDYETDHKVTFAALDNDALDAVRTAYAADDSDELRSAICDLLGLA